MNRLLDSDNRTKRKERTVASPKTTTTTTQVFFPSFRGQFEDDDDDDEVDTNMMTDENNTAPSLSVPDNSPTWGKRRNITPWTSATPTADVNKPTEETAATTSSSSSSSGGTSFFAVQHESRPGDEPRKLRSQRHSNISSLIPKECLNIYFQRNHSVEPSKMAKYYVSWHKDDVLLTKEKLYTSIFVSPLTGEIFPSGRYSENGTLEQPHAWSIVQNVHIYWYKRKATAESAAAARAYDCLQHRAVPPRDAFDWCGLDHPYQEGKRPYPQAAIPFEKMLEIQQIIANNVQKSHSLNNNHVGEVALSVNTSPATMQPNQAIPCGNIKDRLGELYWQLWKINIPRHQYVPWERKLENNLCLHTAAFVCPRTGEVFFSGARDSESRDASDDALGGTFHWYRDSKSAEDAAAARAYDCRQYRCLGGKASFAQLCTNAPYHSIDDHQILPTGIPEDALNKIHRMVLFAQNDEMRRSSADDAQAQLPEYTHPEDAQYDETKALAPKTALVNLYQKSERYRGLCPSSKNYITWDDGGPPHCKRFTSVFVCPISGEAFPAGRHGDLSSYILKNDIYWYSKKKSAENGAAARTFDCFEFRKAREENETYSFIGFDKPYGKNDYTLPDDSFPPHIVSLIREIQEQAIDPT